MNSLCLNLALTSLFWLNNELFTCLSPRGRTGLTLLLPSLLLWSVPGTHVAPPGWGRGRSGEGALSSGSKGTCSFLGGGEWVGWGAAGPAGWSGSCSLWGHLGLRFPAPPREAGCELRGSYLCGPARVPVAGRRRPAEEVMRVLPGAGRGRGSEAALSLQSDINSRPVGGGVEQYTQEERWEQPALGAGVGAVFLGLSVCQSGLGRCRGVALAGKGRVVEGPWPGPPSPAWHFPTCPPTRLACLGSQACSGLRPLAGASGHPHRTLLVPALCSGLSTRSS